MRVGKAEVVEGKIGGLLDQINDPRTTPRWDLPEEAKEPTPFDRWLENQDEQMIPVDQPIGFPMSRLHYGRVGVLVAGAYEDADNSNDKSGNNNDKGGHDTGGCINVDAVSVGVSAGVNVGVAHGEISVEATFTGDGKDSDGSSGSSGNNNEGGLSDGRP